MSIQNKINTLNVGDFIQTTTINNAGRKDESHSIYTGIFSGISERGKTIHFSKATCTQVYTKKGIHFPSEEIITFFGINVTSIIKLIS